MRLLLLLFSLPVVSDSATPFTGAHQASLSWGWQHVECGLQKGAGRKRRENQDTEWEEISLVQKTDKKLNPEYTNINRKKIRTFLVAQCLRILLPLQGTRVWSLVKEDHTCLEQLSPWVTTTEPTLPRALLCNKRSHNNAKLVHCNLPQLEKAHTQQQRSSADKNKLI